MNSSTESSVVESDALKETSVTVKMKNQSNISDGEKGLEARVEQPSPSKSPPKRKVLFYKKLVTSCVLISVVFWVNLCWLLGSYYRGSENMNRTKMLVIDYDGSSVGSALLSAVNEANGPRTNPTYIIATAESHDVQEVERAVFVGKYWGAVFSTVNATARLDAAIQGTNASEYVADSAYVLVGNSARYTAFYSEIVTENLESVADAAKTYYMQHNIASFLSESLTNGTTLSSSQIQTILNPIGYTSIDTSYGPFTFGDRTLLNTLLIVVVVLCQFFFLMSLNGLSMAFGLFKVSRTDYFKTRLPISSAWAILAGLFVTSWQMVFKESYPINARLFFSLWTLYTVFSVIIFDVLDILTAFVPAQYIPFCMFTWMITNVTSAGSPPELSNVFFRVSYFFPARAMWFTEQHIWSQGGAYDLSLSLPILAAWLVIAKIGTIFTVAPRRKAAAAGPPRGKR